MPADFQRAVIDDVVPAVRRGLVTGPNIDVMLLAKARACVDDPDSDLARPLRGAGKAEAVICKRFAELEHLTHGARELVRSASSLNQVLGYVFRDKEFRNYLRANVHHAEQARRMNILIAGASALADLKEAPSRPVAAPPAKASSAKAAPAATPTRPTPAPKREPSMVPQAVLEGVGEYAPVAFEYRWHKEAQSGSVGELAALLADPASETLAGNQMAGVLASDHPHALVVLSRLVTDGRLEATPRAAALLRLFVARMYLMFNAVESADRLATALLEDGPAFDALPDGEKLRLRNVLARCALRSGRPAAAVELYRDIFAENPGSPSALMSVVGSAFAVDPALARSLAKVALINNYAVSESDLTFVGDILTGNGDFEQAEAAFFRILQKDPTYFDGYIGLANLELARGDRNGWSRYLKRYFQSGAQLRIDIDDSEPLAPFSVRAVGVDKVSDHPRVTVVMTTFNAGPTVDLAVQSVLDQVLSDVELIVVDDCSEDDSRERVMAIAQRDPRVRWLHNESNVGTYCSKNRGIEIATGEYVTFHDSDDWMHPLRLLRHLEAMRGGSPCTTSNWLRMDESGRTIVRRGGPYTHLNPASTFMPKGLFERIGPFDAVRTGADSEILARVRMSFGAKSVVNLPGCLGLGLHHENSLTQSGATAFDEFRYSPVRLAYTEGWLAWHLEQLEAGPRELNLVHDGDSRKFPIPDAIAPHQPAQT